MTYIHYHPNVHEAYAVILGSSTLYLGLDVTANTSDNPETENCAEVEVSTGDVIVLPAGVSHCSKDYSPEYRYLAAYPKEGEKYRLVRDIHVKRLDTYDNSGDIAKAKRVPIPADPIFGSQGLPQIWA